MVAHHFRVLLIGSDRSSRCSEQSDRNAPDQAPRPRIVSSSRSNIPHDGPSWCHISNCDRATVRRRLLRSCDRPTGFRPRRRLGHSEGPRSALVLQQERLFLRRPEALFLRNRRRSRQGWVEQFEQIGLGCYFHIASTTKSFEKTTKHRAVFRPMLFVRAFVIRRRTLELVGLFNEDADSKQSSLEMVVRCQQTMPPALNCNFQPEKGSISEQLRHFHESMSGFECQVFSRTRLCPLCALRPIFRGKKNQHEHFPSSRRHPEIS